MRTTLLLLAMAVGRSCSTPDDLVCTAIAVPAMQVTVIDAQNGSRVCDAQVTAVDGTFRAVLDAFPNDPLLCAYAGPFERPGVYTVEVVRAGYQPAAAQGIRVSSDECHVQTQVIRIVLSR